MKNKKTLLMFTLVFILILIGASVLYNKLSANIAPEGNGLITENSSNTNEQNNDKQNNETTNNELTENNNSNQEITEHSTQENKTQEENSSNSEETEKTKAPDFTVFDSEGNEVHLSGFIGKPVVVNFWASWCGPCKMEMPDFDAAYAELGDEIHFLMVNMTDNSRETVEVAKSYIEQQGFTFPVYFDTEMDAAITYGVTSLPTTYFIDAEGYAIAQAMGAIDSTTLQTGIDMITSN